MEKKIRLKKEPTEKYYFQSKKRNRKITRLSGEFVTQAEVDEYDIPSHLLEEEK